MLATVKRYGTGRCLIEGTEGEGVEVEFPDGTIRGFLSLKEFNRLMKARSDNGAGGCSKADSPPFGEPRQ